MINFDAEKYRDNKGLELPNNVQNILIKIADNLYKKDKIAYFAFIDTLEDEGILIEHNWPGHRKGHFFPDVEDGYIMEDWLFQIGE